MLCRYVGSHAQTPGGAPSGGNKRSEEDGGCGAEGVGQRFQDSRWKVRLRFSLSFLFFVPSADNLHSTKGARRSLTLLVPTDRTVGSR